MGAAFMIPAIISAVGTGAQYMSQRSATNQSNDIEEQAIQNQQDFRNEALGNVNKLTQQIQTDTPTQIAQQATGQYVQNLRKNAGANALAQGGPTSALPPDTVGSPRYASDVANSNAQVQAYGNTLAGEMGNIDAATRERQNEGLSMGTVATTLNGLNQQSNAQGFVDQLRARTAATPNPWVGLMSGLLQNGARAYAMNANLPTTTTTVAPPLQSGNYGYGPPAGINA